MANENDDTSAVTVPYILYTYNCAFIPTHHIDNYDKETWKKVYNFIA